MSALAVFQHEKFGDVQVIAFEGAIYFNPDMVAKALGYNETRSMLRVFETIPQEDMSLYVRHFTYQELSELHVKGEVKKNQSINWSANGKRFLTEPGLFLLLNRSEKPNAYPFQKWVNTQVLPQLRQNGIYQLTPQNNNQSIAQIENHLLAIAKQQQEMFAVIQGQQQEIKQEIREMKQEIEKIKKQQQEIQWSCEWTANDCHQLTVYVWELQKLHPEFQLTSEKINLLYHFLRQWSALNCKKQGTTKTARQPPYTADSKVALKEMLIRLQKQGKNYQALVDFLNENQTSTLSGQGKWTTAKVKRLLNS